MQRHVRPTQADLIAALRSSVTGKPALVWAAQRSRAG